MRFLRLLIISLSILGFFSCGKEDRPIIDLGNEIFTSFQMTFNPLGGGNVVIYGSEDLGDIGVPMAAASGTLMVNTTYDARLVLFNRKVTPNKNLTSSVQDEGTNYQVYAMVNPDNVFQSITYNDMDSNGNPLGFNMTFTTSERFTTGNLRFTLKRGVDKSVPYILGKAIPSQVGGEELIDVVFDVKVQ